MSISKVEEFLNRINREEGELMKIIKRRKLEYLGHIFRGHIYSILQLILNGKIEQRGIGRMVPKSLSMQHTAQNRGYRQIGMKTINA